MQQTQAEFEAASAFGQEVNRMRAMRELTQRAFAQALTDKGMPVDASAVSRIEKGARSVRLSEAMIIADVLDVPLDFLVEGTKTPSQAFRSRRRAADMTIGALEDAISDFLVSFSEADEFLKQHPDLLAECKDEIHGTPATVEDYLPWVGRRLAAIREESGADVWADTQEEADALLEVLYSYIRRAVTVTPEGEEGVGDGKHQEEA